MDFFQHRAYLHARVARVKCPENGVQLVEVSGARPGGGFTLLLDDMLAGDGGICRDLLGTGVTGVTGVRMLLARLS